MHSQAGSVTYYSQPPGAWGYDPVMKNASTSVLPSLCPQKAPQTQELRKAEPRPAIIRPMGAYDDLSPQELARIRRFVEGADIDTTLVTDELRDLVEQTTSQLENHTGTASPLP